MKLEIYCDESRQDLLAERGSISETNRYCCIGGLMVESDCRQEVKSKIHDLMERHNVHGELKWTTVSPKHMTFYLELVDLFFSLPSLTFRTVVIDASKVDNNQFNRNDQELGYYKFYYQLLIHWIDRNSCYWVYTDQKTNRDKKRLKELRRIVNLGFRSAQPITSIQAIDSSESVILQMQNVLMGAVGYRYNFRGKGASAAKEAVANRVEYHTRRSISHTYQSERKFNVFEISLREVH